jgi:hypothetical protein
MTTITGLIVVIGTLIEQYQKGLLSPWMLAVGIAGAVFVRLTDENWAGKVKTSIESRKP